MNGLATQSLTSLPNYEAMYIELEKRFHALEREKERLFSAVGGLERENEKLRAQLDVVHLIFGGSGR